MNSKLPLIRTIAPHNVDRAVRALDSPSHCPHLPAVNSEGAHARRCPYTPMSAVDTQHEINSNYYFNLISFTLLYYEFFITFGAEVSRFWGLPATSINVLFFLNRYGMLFGTIPVIFQYFWTIESTPHKLVICGYLHSYHEYFAVVTQIVIGVMLILRTYALYERNRRVLALMVVVSAGVIAVGAWSVIAGPGAKEGDDVPPLNIYIGCSAGITTSSAVGLAAAWAGMGCFDITIFLLTLYRALSRQRARGLDLVTVLLRDGSIYFGVIVAANLANILSFVLAGPYTRGLPTTFTNVISSVMISRLMLNLRDPALSTMSGRLTASGSATLTGDGMFSTYLSYTDAARGLETHLSHNDIELENRLYP